MAQTCAEMVDEVKARCGRSDDEVLVTQAQVTTWFNEAQQDIVTRTPGLHAMSFKNTTSHDTTQSLAYAIGDITGGDYTNQSIANIWDVFYLDGADSQRLHFVHTDEFDANWPDPTDSEAVFAKPHHWTRRGKNIEIRPVCSSAYYDKDLRFDGDFFARDFTTYSDDASDLSSADAGLKYYALAQAWRDIGNIVKAADYSGQYESWLERYQTANDRLLEWPGNLYSDDIA